MDFRSTIRDELTARLSIFGPRLMIRDMVEHFNTICAAMDIVLDFDTSPDLPMTVERMQLFTAAYEECGQILNKTGPLYHNASEYYSHRFSEAATTRGTRSQTSLHPDNRLLADFEAIQAFMKQSIRRYLETMDTQLDRWEEQRKEAMYPSTIYTIFITSLSLSPS